MSLSVDIRKRLGDFALEVSFDTQDAGVLALLGPSGCGKSMTLKCIAGVERPDSGRIVLNGRVLFDSSARVDLPPQERHVGYLFQNYALFPNMSVWKNVLAAAHALPRDQREAAARDAIRRMRLEGLEGHRPAELSGGQQQRCAMARILVSRPDVILLDEPFSALDGYLRWQLEMELADTLGAFGGEVVLVSHNRDEVYRLCDTVCVISDGRGEPRIGIRELFEAPRTLAAALISGCKNVSRAAPRGEGLLRCEDWGVTLRTTLPVRNATHAGIRAHYLRHCPEGVATSSLTAGRAGEKNLIAGAVERVIESTFSTIVMVRTPGGGSLRWELQKGEWRSVREGLGADGRVCLAVAPADVMPLTDDARAEATKEVPAP